MTETKSDNKYLFESMPVAKAVLKMAVPTMIGQLIVLIYNMADTFFIGQVNDPSMVAAASLVLPVFNICLSIAGVAGVGGGAFLSRLLGEARHEELKKSYSFCLYISVGIGALFALAVLLFMKPLLYTLGADDATYGFARTYALCVIVFGGIPTIMSNVFANIVRAVGESAKAGFGVTLGGVINVFLDPLFMFVLFPGGNEILGAGVATVLSNCISCAYFIFIIKTKTGGVLKLKPIAEFPEFSSVKMIFTLGVPAAISTLLFDIDYIVIDKLMSGYGDIALASVGIVLKAERFPLNVGTGICQGMLPMVAYNHATKSYDRMKKISHFSFFLCIVTGLFSIAVYESFAPGIIRLFIKNSEAVILGTNFLRARCLATLFMLLSFYYATLFGAYGNGNMRLFLGVMRWAVFNIPLLFILEHIFGMYGIVWAQLCAEILSVALSFFVHYHYLKKNGIVN